MWRSSLELRLYTLSRLELATSWTLLCEQLLQLVDGRPHWLTDWLALGHLDLDYRFAQGERAHFRLGASLRALSDHTGNDFGADLHWGFDAFLAAPVVWSVSLALGRLGQAWLFDGRTSLGFMLGRGELLLGYQHLQVGKVPLGGPFAGLRLWL